jgi:cellulose synthase/poly-beta-1,6-N-acetylglucosamine synthase-like glycosyltransferase
VAVLPLFVLGPNAFMSLIGHIRGPRPVQAPDPALVRELDVDVVIPAYNERFNIALCLASVMRQTIKPNSVTVIDDGSRDDTAAIAEAFAAANNFAVRVIRRRSSIGKTPGLKIESRNLEGDVEFILDADTVLMSDDFIEKTVAQLYRVPGIASVCGVIHPLRDVDRESLMNLDTMSRLFERQPDLDLAVRRTPFNRIAHAISNFDRDAVFQFIQIFYYGGIQNLFGTLPNPVGCAVAYRREYLKEMFDTYEPAMGDDLTSSEDIFLGTALMAHGYHNSQVQTVFAYTDMPEPHRIPGQLVKWSSAWLQTAYHMPQMLASPLRAMKRFLHNRRNKEAAQKRRVVDGYRQPFGFRFVEQLGRPSGWIITVGIFEKLAFLLVLLLLVVMQAWFPLVLTMLFESTLFVLFLAVFSKGRRVEYALKGISATPFRYAMMVFETVVFMRFVFDLVIQRRLGGWRK